MSFVASPSVRLSSSKTLHLAVPVGMRPRPRVARMTSTICSANEKDEGSVAPALAATVVASLVMPEFVGASTLNPSIVAFLKSVVAGGVVAGLILGAVTLVAIFDPISRD